MSRCLIIIQIRVTLARTCTEVPPFKALQSRTLRSQLSLCKDAGRLQSNEAHQGAGIEGAARITKLVVRPVSERQHVSSVKLSVAYMSCKHRHFDPSLNCPSPPVGTHVQRWTGGLDH